MWRNWNPLNPPINPTNSSDEGENNNYESADESELVSPNRPHQSASASPRALLRPDPPHTEEVLHQVGQQLRALPTREQRVANRNAHREAQEAAQVAAEQAAAAVARAAAMPNVVDFDAENGVDGEKAQDHARHIKMDFDQSDVKFWFSQLEAEMEMGDIKSQWLKKTVLQRNLPNKQREDVKSYLLLPKTQAGNEIYLNIKNRLIKIYAPKPSDSYNKALTRAMVGLPSQLGLQIIDDICRKPTKLEGCCCAGAAFAIWSNRLPVNIRAHISQKEFTKDSYKDVFDAADQVFLASKQVEVAAVSAGGLDETLPAFSTQNQPSEVAAVGKGSGKNKKNKKNNKGQGQGGQNGQGDKNQSRGQKHSSIPDNLADKMCSRHYRHGATAYFCVAPLTCPWVNKVSARD